MHHYRTILSAGAVFALMAVLVGAFGAHALEPQLSPKMLQRYQTAVDYQFYHSFALLLCGILACYQPMKTFSYSALAFICGIVLFSGSLYAYVLTDIRAIAIITPIGGLCFILGWSLLLLAIRQLPVNKTQ